MENNHKGVNKEDQELAHRIAKRYARMADAGEVPAYRFVAMVWNLYGTRMEVGVDLAGLLASDAIDFAHAIRVIRKRREHVRRAHILAGDLAATIGGIS